MTVPSAQPALFNRKWSVQVDTVQTDTLRVAFAITKTATKEPNRVALSVYNLSETTRSQLRRQNVAIQVSAGYSQVSSLIFSGNVRAIEHVREHTEWVTKITGGDGELPIRTKRISRSWKPGVMISTVLLDLANATTIGLGNIATIAGDNNFRKGVTKFARGYSVQGSAYESLYTLARSLGYQLSVQDGQLKMVAIDNADVAPVVSLSPSSGLIGSPQVAERFMLKCTSLLNGSFYPGRKVQLKSARYDGLYRVMALQHKGDSHGNDWFTHLTLIGLSNPLPGHPP